MNNIKTKWKKIKSKTWEYLEITGIVLLVIVAATLSVIMGIGYLIFMIFLIVVTIIIAVIKSIFSRNITVIIKNELKDNE